MGIALVLVTTVQIALYGFTDEGDIFEPEFIAGNSAISGIETSGDQQPDVYFILTDAYARADTLKEYFGYDNSDFIRSLKSMGFLVASQSVGNYPTTSLVVNSMLNMDYVANENGMMMMPNGDRLKLAGRINDNVVGQLFQSMGYQIYTIRSTGLYIQIAGAKDSAHLTSWWWPNDDFERALFETSVLPLLFKKLPGKMFSDRERVDFVFADVLRKITRPGPKFVFAHIMAPHQPFIYNRDGSYTKGFNPAFGSVKGLPETISAYRDQVHYLNSLLENMISEILSQSATDPIIVLQGDHGLRLTRYSKGVEGSRTDEFNGTCPRELLTNLNAMYLPGDKGRKNFYDSISSVNTFRLIFDSYFGGNYGFVEDHAYVPRYSEKDATFTDVTQTSRECSAEWEQAFSDAK
jgi:hypothetical protein